MIYSSNLSKPWVTHLFVRAAQLLLAATLASPLTSCIQLESPDSALQAPEQETVLDSAVLPPAMNYDLGEATLVQERFPEDSRFRKMPVRLNGLIATPKAVDAPAPGGGDSSTEPILVAPWMKPESTAGPVTRRLSNPTIKGLSIWYDNWRDGGMWPSPSTLMLKTPSALESQPLTSG